MKELAYVNGKICPLADAKISILDPGFLYGDGCFESLRTFGRKPFLLQEHLKRLLAGLRTLKIKPPASLIEITKLIDNLLDQSQLNEAYIKLIITRGVKKPSLIIFVRPLPQRKKSNNKIVISRWIRPEQPISRLKTLNYLNNLLVAADEKISGADEVIQVDSNGYVTEGTKSNIFIVKHNVIIIPPTTLPILPGVIRAHVIKLAKRLGYKVVERKFKVKELLQANEVFITNSLLGVQPINLLDKKIFKTGSITRELIKQFKRT